jgi:hypothetical protein
MQAEPRTLLLGLWNSILIKFLDNLKIALPDEKLQIDLFRKTIVNMDTSSDLDSKWTPLRTFALKVFPHKELIEQRDESFIREHATKIGFLKHCNIDTNWDKLGDANRKAFWETIAKLNELGGVIMAVPEDQWGAIGDMANSLLGSGQLGSLMGMFGG